MSNTMAVTVLLLLLLFLPSAVNITVTLSRIAGTPKYFFEARSLIVCRTKCERECNNNNSTVWSALGCNGCVQNCIKKENLIYEDGPQDRGLIRYVGICCARLVTYSRISAKLIFDIENEPVVEQAVGVLEYRVLTDDDDLHEPIWSLSQTYDGRCFYFVIKLDPDVPGDVKKQLFGGTKQEAREMLRARKKGHNNFEKDVAKLAEMKEKEKNTAGRRNKRGLSAANRCLQWKKWCSRADHTMMVDGNAHELVEEEMQS